MAKIHPFRGVRYSPEKFGRDITDLVTQPYDKITPEMQEEYYRRHPKNFVRIVLGKKFASDDEYHNYYVRAAGYLNCWLEDGVFVEEEKPAIYVYHQEFEVDGKPVVRKGFVALAELEPPGKGVKAHEKTLAGPKADRLNLTRHIRAQVGHIFMLYSDPERKIDQILEKAIEGREPDIVAKDWFGNTHKMWRVDDPEIIAQVQKNMEDKTLFIADGHHRSASASRVQKIRKEKNPNHNGEESYNFFLSVIFPDNQMMIMDYNRVVRDLAGKTPRDFIGKLMPKFTIEEKQEQYKPKELHEFGMFIDRRWYRLTARAGSFDPDDPVGSLDVAILQENLLAPILGIGDPRTDRRIDFVGGIRGTGELEKRCAEGWAVAFALFPTSIHQLMTVADAGVVMPPKSTWFEPKLRSGLIVRPLDE